MNHCLSLCYSLEILFIATLSLKVPTLFTILYQHYPRLILVYNQKPSGDNQIDLFMHFLAMSHNGQVTMDGCKTQVLF